MSSSLAERAGPALRRTPNARHQALRRRLGIVCALAALALASGVLGSLAGRPAQPLPAHAHWGPFSYFPRQ